MKYVAARTLVLAFAVVAALVVSGCGSDHDEHSSPSTTPSGAARTINVDMVDVDFNPASIQVAKGETVRFVFTNKGTLPHDAFVGSKQAQDEHEKEMRAGGADHGHAGAEAVTVNPGGTGELTHTFTESGELEIGCHQTGHYDTGMKIDVSVS